MPVVIALIIVFCALALVHVYWALGGRALKAAAIPQVEGKRAFNPSRLGTLAVACALVAAAALVALDAGLLTLPLPPSFIRTFVFVLAFVLFARAIGDFRLVGFFKRVHASHFARLDTLVYSPLCLVVAAGVFYVGWIFAT
jgi:hypothetical protein